MPNENQTPPIINQVGTPPTRLVNLIVVHCSATPSGKPLTLGTPGTPGYQNAPKIINAWHAARGFHRQPDAVRGFSPALPSIGYHFVIDLDGTVWSGRGLNEVGAHVAGYNANSVGICMVGGAELVGRYTPAQWASLTQVVSMLLAEFHIPCTAPKRISDTAVSAGVCGHRDLSPDLNHDGQITTNEWLKTCPGFDVRAYLANGLKPLAQHIFQEVPA
jgi:N-acetylmuramoyl-L-alanine amidase